MRKIFTLAFCVAAAFSAMAEGFTPEDGVWYRLLNKETGGGREGSYLGYYPETQWYVFNKETGDRDALGTNPFVVAGDIATEENADDAQIAGQLWQFVAGEDGKYCLVNKAYPSGAISNVIVNNNGSTEGVNGLNPTRWQYLDDRDAEADKICWFDWSSEPSEKDGDTYYQPTFTNYIDESGIYIAVAAGGQKRQIIRVNTAYEASTWWAPLAVADNTDSVVEINAESKTNAVYNLMGCRVSKATKGIFIINGKKTLVK